MRFIGNLLAGITSLVYFVVLIAMAGVLVLSNVFSADYFTNVLSSIEFSEIKLADLGIEMEGAENLQDLMVNALGEAGINETEAKKIVESEKTKEVAGEFIVETINYLSQGGEIPQVDSKDIKEIIDREELNGINIDQAVDEVNKMLKEMLEGGELTYVGQ